MTTPTYPESRLVDSVLDRRYGKRWPGPHQQLDTIESDGLPVSLSASIDPRHEMPPVFDQLKIGSCTSNATGAAMEYDTHLDGKDCGRLSRRWIYHFEKTLEHTNGQGDTGAIGHDAFRVAKHGIPSEDQWPYSDDIMRVEEAPPPCEPRVYYQRKPVRAVPQDWQTIQRCFNNRQTICFGFTVYESFEDESWWHGGEMPLPDLREGILGGHEVVACGYLADYPGFCLCRNSWGKHVMLGGYFLMPVAVLTSRSLASDLRTIVR